MTYDVFISYSHRDNSPREGKKHGWVDSFDLALKQNITDFLGRTPNIFRDNKMEGYQGITDTVFNNIESSLLLIPVLSPNFLTSGWCPKELAAFCDNNMTRPGSRCQIFPIIKTPIDNLPHQLTDKLVKHQFYLNDGEGERLVLFRPDLDEELETKFYLKIGDLAREIARYIKSVSAEKDGPAPQAAGDNNLHSQSPNGRPVIYLAEPSPDLWEQYEDIRRDLVQRGNVFLPADLNGQTPKPQSADIYRESVRGEIETCRLAVNLIGKCSNGYPRLSELSYQQLQMEVAAERDDDADYKRLIWLPKDIQIDDPEQQKFIDEIRNSASARVEFIQNSLEEFKSCIQDALKPPPPPPVLPADDEPPWVYVLYDKSDLELSRKVEDMLYDKNCAVLPTRAYLEPALSGDLSVDVNDQHKTWLNTCDAVLIYWNAAPTPWVLNKILELQRIKAERKGRGFRSRAVFCDGDMPAEQKTRFLPPIGSLLKVKGYSELPAFLSQLEVPAQ